jgi:hypothetical protein
MHRTAALPLFTTMLDCGRRLIILPLYRAEKIRKGFRAQYLQ